MNEQEKLAKWINDIAAGFRKLILWAF